MQNGCSPNESNRLLLQRRFTTENPKIRIVKRVGEKKEIIMCKETCKISAYKVSENKSFYHAVQCNKMEDISQEQKVIENLQRNSQKTTEGNWSNSMYTSSIKEVALSYIAPMETEGHLVDDEYYVIELGLKSELNYICCTDSRFAEGNEESSAVSETDFKYIEENIGKNENSLPFMTYLGEKRYAFECYHDPERNTELIVPAQLVTKEQFYIKNIEKWKVNKYSERYKVKDFRWS